MKNLRLVVVLIIVLLGLLTLRVAKKGSDMSNKQKDKMIVRLEKSVDSLKQITKNKTIAQAENKIDSFKAIINAKETNESHLSYELHDAYSALVGARDSVRLLKKLVPLRNNTLVNEYIRLSNNFGELNQYRFELETKIALFEGNRNRPREQNWNGSPNINGPW